MDAKAGSRMYVATVLSSDAVCSRKLGDGGVGGGELDMIRRRPTRRGRRSFGMSAVLYMEDAAAKSGGRAEMDVVPRVFLFPPLSGMTDLIRPKEWGTTGDEPRRLRGDRATSVGFGGLCGCIPA